MTTLEVIFVSVFGVGFIAVGIILFQSWAIGRELDRERDGLDLEDNP